MKRIFNNGQLSRDRVCKVYEGMHSISLLEFLCLFSFLLSGNPLSSSQLGSWHHLFWRKVLFSTDSRCYLLDIRQDMRPTKLFLLYPCLKFGGIDAFNIVINIFRIKIVIFLRGSSNNQTLYKLNSHDIYKTYLCLAVRCSLSSTALENLELYPKEECAYF